MTRSSPALALALSVGVLGSCKRESNDPPPEPVGSASAELPAGTEPPRRPTKRWYMARTQERCEVYSVDGEVVSSPTAAPCPRYLEVGERIRIAGKTCIREGSPDSARQVPVVCPDPLTNAEKQDRDRPR